MVYNLYRGIVYLFFYFLDFMQPAKMKWNTWCSMYIARNLFPLKLLPIQETLSTHLNNHSIPPYRKR